MMVQGRRTRHGLTQRSGGARGTARAGESRSAECFFKLAWVLALVPWLLLSGGCEGTAPGPEEQASGGAGASGQACASDDDCSSGAPVCVPGQGCMGCAEDRHCAEDEQCTDGQCRADCEIEGTCSDPVPCKTALDCQVDSMCGTEGFCVACVQDADCPDEQVCQHSPDAQPECRPKCAVDEDCGGSLDRCHVKSGHCRSCTQDAHCPADSFCAQGECSPDTCKPGVSRCVDNAVSTCKDNGSGQKLSPCPAGQSCTQTDAGAACKPWVCDPDGTACDGAGRTLRTCADDGLSYSSEVSCEGGRCEDAECKAIKCAPGSRTCMGHDLYQCSGSGTSLSLLEACSEDEYCDNIADACRQKVCGPGSMVCDGDVLRDCKSDGSGPDPRPDALVKDCAASGQACFGGACQDILCDFETRCSGTTVQTCMHRATYIDEHKCPIDEHCVEGTPASCQADVCEQGKTSCSDDTHVVDCNADGSAVVATWDCAPDRLTCHNGGCWGQVGEGVGGASTSGRYFWNVYQAEQAGKLTRISQNLRASDYSNYYVYFSVWEGDSLTGEYSYLGGSSSSLYSSKAAYRTSSLLDIELTKGKFYLVGINVKYIWDAYYGLTEADMPVGPLRWKGRVSSTYGTSPVTIESLDSTAYAYKQRLAFE